MEKREEEEEQKKKEDLSSLFSFTDSMFMDPTNSGVWRNPERWLDTEVDFIKAEVQILQLKASFLKVLLSFRGRWHVENGNLEHLLTRILVGFQNADLDLQRLWLDFFIRNSSAFFIWKSSGFSNRTSLEKSLFMPTNMDGLLSGMQERLKLLQPDIDQVYTVLTCDADKIDDWFATMVIQEQLEKIQNFSCPDDFLLFSSRFHDSQLQLLNLSERLVIQTCFRNDIKALFSREGLVLNNDLWLLGYRREFDNFLRQMETKKKMTDKADQLDGPSEDETRFA